MPERITETFRIKMKMLDDVFHKMIIALERLELFLEVERRGKEAVKLAITGINSSRDLHDDEQNPPNRELVLSEVQLQCSALFFQTRFDDEDLFKQTMKYFMTDLLEWYGGRGKDIPYDEVEMYVLPILVALSRQIDSVVEIMQVCNDYVAKIRSIEEFSDTEKEEAVKDGFVAILKAQQIVGEQLKEFEASGEDVQFSEHRRGTVRDGYCRLMDAMLKLYTTATPAKKIRAIFTAYVDGLPEFTDEVIEKAMTSQGQVQNIKEFQDTDTTNALNPKDDLATTDETSEIPNASEVKKIESKDQQEEDATKMDKLKAFSDPTEEMLKNCERI